MTNEKTFKAIIWLIFSIICFDLMAVHIRYLSVTYTAEELSFYRNTLGLIPSILLLYFTAELSLNFKDYKIKQWKLAFFRGLVVALAQLLFYTAISKLELATVATLGQTSTFFIVVLAIIIYNENVGIWRWAAIFIGLFGAILVIRPGSDIFTWNSLLPIGASFCYALSIVTLRSFTRDISNSILYLYSAAAAAFGAGIYASISITFTPVQSYFDMLLLLSMSFCGGFGVVCLMIAYRAADVSAIAPFNYFGILSSFILGWVIFGEFPLETLLPGVFFIVAAGLIIIWREKINKN